jgi:hypothetical protein
MKRPLFWSAVVSTGLALVAVNAWYALVPPESFPIPLRRDQSHTADGTTVKEELVDITRQLDLDQARLRPLFLKSRTPWSAPVVETPPPPVEMVEPSMEPPAALEPTSEPLEATLVGIQRDSAGAKALVSLAGADVRWVRQGEDIQGWTIDRIDDDAIDLSSGDHRRKLELFPTLAEELQ